jgi:hypothetical protein
LQFVEFSFFFWILQICDSVFSFHEPERFPKSPPTVEIVFIHGLQLSGFKDAYWKTWIVRGEDGNELPNVNCWPMTWLAEEFPGARILSLSYDSSAVKKVDQGMMDVYALGEKLVQEMVGIARVGQHNCPVVFVCHSLGGLVVKKIVCTANSKFSRDQRYIDFLQNIKGFHFYATPHDGSKLADLADKVPFLKKSALVPFLKVINDHIGRLNQEFEQLVDDNFRNVWEYAVVAEANKTTFVSSEMEFQNHFLVVLCWKSVSHIPPLAYFICCLVDCACREASVSRWLRRHQQDTAATTISKLLDKITLGFANQQANVTPASCP